MTCSCVFCAVYALGIGKSPILLPQDAHTRPEHGMDGYTAAAPSPPANFRFCSINSAAETVQLHQTSSCFDGLMETGTKAHRDPRGEGEVSGDMLNDG